MMQPLYIQVHARDNVAIIVNPEGLPAGTLFPSGLSLTERIPQSHKVALQEIAAGEPIVRYGQIIGLAARVIARGSWVREELLHLPQAPSLDELPLATATPAPLPPLTGHTFEGFRNPDGSVGTKNILGITTTVQCVAPTVDYAVRRIKAEILPRFPAVDDVVAITHTYGCGVAIDAPGAAIPIRTLRNIGLHANLGGAPLIVSLGCEKLQPARLFPEGFNGPHAAGPRRGSTRCATAG
jgi:galactarate dehydratase